MQASLVTWRVHSFVGEDSDRFITAIMFVKKGTIPSCNQSIRLPTDEISYIY